MLSLYGYCSVLLQLICAVLMQTTFQNYHHYKTNYLCQITTTTKVRFIFAVFVCRAWQCSVTCGYVLYMLLVFIQSLICMCIQDLTPHAARVLLRQDTIYVVLYLVIVADFLLVYIYTLRNGLRDKELRSRVSGKAADLAHFYA